MFDPSPIKLHPQAPPQAPVGSPADRRRRRRRPTRLPGWIYRTQDGQESVREVQMRNISPEGAGFITGEILRKGQMLHLKIGIGSTRQPRQAEVMFVRARSDGQHEVGVRFVRRIIR